MITLLSVYPKWERIKQIKLENLLNFQSKFSFLVGSGISVDPPSNLPSGFTFTRNLLEQIVPTEELDFFLSICNPERQNKINYGNFIRFEMLMELISFYFDRDLKILDFYKKCHNPNLNHLNLARLLENDHYIFTTNFDHLIETALLNIGISLGEINIIYDESQIDDISVKKYRVYKLHGSLYDIKKKEDVRSSIQATLRQISAKKDNFMQNEPLINLPLWKKEILESKIINNDLIVMGYSGLDDFDIIPTLLSIESERNLIWIDHKANLDLNSAIIERLTWNQVADNNKENNDRVGRILMQFAETKTRQIERIFRIQINSSIFLSYLVKKSNLQDCNSFLQNTPINNKIEKILENSILISLDFLQKGLFISRIYLIMGYNQRAKDILYKIEEQIFESGKNEQILEFLDMKTQICYLDQNYTDALVLTNQIKNLYQKMDNPNQVAIKLIHIAHIYYILNDYNELFKNIEEAIKILQTLNDSSSLSKVWNLLGSVNQDFKKYEKAEQYYKKSIEKDRSDGDLYLLSVSLTNYGTLLKGMGRYEEAFEVFQEVHTICEKLGNLSLSLINYSHLGNFFDFKHNFKKANEFYIEGLKLSEILNSIDNKIYYRIFIANNLMKMGEKIQAFEFFLPVITIYDENKVQKGIKDMYENAYRHYIGNNNNQ